MTNRDFLTAVATSELATDIKAFALAEIDKLDKKNAKRKNTPNKTQIANIGLKYDICELLADGTKVASEIASALGITTQKASALCKQLVETGCVSVADVKVKGKGTVKGYTLIVTAETVED